MSQKRIAALRKQFQKENLDGMVIARADRIFYLCGYTGSNGLLVVTNKTALFLTDFRYTDQAKKEVRGARVHVMTKGELVACLAEFPQLNKKNLRLGFSAGYFSLNERDRLKEALPNILPVSADSVVAELGWVKEAQEIKHIARAAEIGDIAFGRILGLLKPGVREREVAAELEYQMKMLGSEKPAFDSIGHDAHGRYWPRNTTTEENLQPGAQGAESRGGESAGGDRWQGGR